jgi:IclR family transcriptional regulator, KDG regulon repressor
MESAGRHQALHTVLDVLEALSSGERGVSDISRQLGVAKSGVHKILRNLEERGYVRGTSEQKYRLGLRLWQLGVAAVADLGLRQSALPHMEKLTDLTGEGSLLSVYDRGDAIYLEKVNSPHAVTSTTRVGGRSPAFCTATGKALLAWLPEEEIERVLTGPLEQFNAATVTDPEQIRADLAHVRQRGYALNYGSWRGEVYGVGAPIRDYTGRVIAALGVAGPAFRFATGIEAVAPEVVAAAGEISNELGWEVR